jgi:hypothetical protein
VSGAEQAFRYTSAEKWRYSSQIAHGIPVAPTLAA